MKTPTDELFNIIKSLSSQEKRFFKLFARQNSKYATYLQLFDVIDKLSKYDEKKMLLSLNKKGGMNNLNRIKNYLQETIFRFLEYYYSDYSVEIQLQRALQKIEVLYAKKLLVSAKKCVVKAEKMALENSEHLYLLKIHSWKRKIMLREQDSATFKTYEQKQYISELQHIELYKNNVEYEKINIRVAEILITQSEKGDKKTISELNKILKDPYLKDETKALTFPSKVIYFRILGDIHFLLKNKKTSYNCYKRAIGFFDQAKLPPHDKLILLSKLTMVLHELKKSGELQLVKDKAERLLQSLPKKQQTSSVYNTYITIINNYIAYYLTTLNINEALTISDKISERVEKSATTQNFLVFYWARFLLLFFKADYRKALYCANRVLSAEKTGIRGDIIPHIKLLCLIVHYELGNEDLLPNLCKSYFNYQDKQATPNKAEKIILNFFGKIIPSNENKQDRIKSFSEFKKQLEACKTEKIMGYFNFINWAESKIENKSFEIIIRRNMARSE